MNSKKIAFLLQLILIIVALVAPLEAGPKKKAKKAAKRGTRVIYTAKDLNAAAQKGDVFTIRKCVQGGVLIDTLSEANHTLSPNNLAALHIAAANEQVQALKVLKELGANLEIGDQRGATALHWAAYYARTEAIKTLTQLGASLEAQDQYGMTALHWAAYYGHIETIEVFNAMGAYVDAKDHEGKTPLHHAAEQGMAACVEILIRAGAHLEAKDNRGCTAVHYAEKAQLEINDIFKKIAMRYANGPDAATTDKNRVIAPIQATIREDNPPLRDPLGVLKAFGADLDAQDNEGKTPLYHAIINGRISTITYLTQLGVSLETQDTSGRSAIHAAAFYGQEKALEVLVHLGANIEAQDLKGNTPLHYAASKGHVKIIEILKNLGADLKACNNEKMTALHKAASGGCAEAIKTLCELGADIHALDFRKGVALHWAAYYGNIDCMSALIAIGANIEAIDVEDRTPLHIAAMGGQLAAIRALKTLGANFEAKQAWGLPPLYSAIRSAKVDALQLLVELGADIEARGTHGETLLGMAIFHDQKDCFQALVTLGANIETKNKDGGTLLHTAASVGSVDTIKILVELGADCEAMDDKGYTPLHKAAQMPKLEPILALIEYGSNLNARAYNGEIPLHLAISRSNLEIIKTLIKFGSKIDSVNVVGSTPYMLALKKEIELKEIFNRACPADKENPFNIKLLENQPIIKQLLSNNDINAILESGYTQLGLAARAGDVKMLALLVAQGANIYVQDAKGYTAQERASLKGQAEAVHFFTIQKNNRLLRIASHKGDNLLIAAYLQAGAQINSLDVSGQGALFCAASRARFATMRYLIEQGADLNLLPKQDLTFIQMLLKAYKPEHKNLLVELLSTQENIHLLDTQGRTLLHWAALYADADAVEFLLEQSLDCEVQDQDGQTALHKAVENADEAVFLTIAQNCQRILHTLDCEGETAFHKAARTGSARLIELCEEYQLDFEARNGRGQTPLEVAREANRPEVIINAIKQAMRWSSLEATPSPTPSLRGPRIWSACEMGVALNTELAVAHKKTNQTNIHDDDDDDKAEAAWYSFGHDGQEALIAPHPGEDDEDAGMGYTFAQSW